MIIEAAKLPSVRTTIPFVYFFCYSALHGILMAFGVASGTYHLGLRLWVGMHDTAHNYSRGCQLQQTVMGIPFMFHVTYVTYDELAV
jgi:hypothetical protein